MQKSSTMRRSGKKIFKGQLTIGLDLGDRSSSYCVLNEAQAKSSWNKSCRQPRKR
jgi:hypothetical protein